MPLTLGYNTNGFPHHRLTDAIEILADLGYRAVALTLDHHALNPYEPDLPARVREVGHLLDRRQLTCVIETGARFLLDPRRKHHPTLLDADPAARDRRLDFLRWAVAIAADLGAPAISLWSGACPADVRPGEAWGFLTDACHDLLPLAEARNVSLAFEPEPGMFIETMDHYRDLRDRLAHPRFGLTLDVGHVHCLADGDPAARVREFAADLRHVHIEDMRRGVHEHLQFGDGDMDFPPLIAALRDIAYDGPVCVELSHHGHDAVNAAKRAFDYLSKL